MNRWKLRSDMRRAVERLRHPIALETAACVAVSLFAALAVHHAREHSGSIIDDAYTTFRHALNLWHGHGFTCNPGERVEGTSSPLFALAMVAPVALGVEPHVAAVFLGTVAFAGCVALAYLMVRSALPDPSSRLLGVVAAGIVAQSPSLAFHSQTGMETLPYACILSVALWRNIVTVNTGCPTLGWAYALGIAALLRPEGFAFFVCVWWFSTIVRLRRRNVVWIALRELAAFGSVWGALLVFRLMYFGRWVPIPVLAKSGHLQSMLHAGPDALSPLLHGPGVAMLARHVFGNPLGTLLLLGAVVFANVRYTVGLAVAVTLGYALVVTWSNGDWMPHDRHMIPCLVPLAAGAVLGLRGFLFHAEQKGPGHWPSVALTMTFLGISLASPPRLAPSKSPGLTKEVALMREVGLRLASTRQSGDRVVSAMAGILPYYWGAPTVDMFGLCDAHIAEQGSILPHGIGRANPGYLASLRPTFYAFEYPLPAAEFFSHPAFAPHRAEYFMAQFPYRYLGSATFDPPILFIRKDRPDVERVAKVLGARLVDAGEELRRIGLIEKP